MVTVAAAWTPLPPSANAGQADVASGPMCREVGEAHMARRLALALTLVLCAFGGLVGDSRGQWSGPYAECVAAMDALHSAAWMDHHPRFEGTPLTVEMWVRLRSSTAYNILIAHEVKSSNAHWEIFTLPESGRLTAYLPGCTPDHVGSSYALTDGVWHYVCMVSEANSVALFVDGAEGDGDSGGRAVHRAGSPLHRLSGRAGVLLRR